MSKIWKWILGIILILVVVAAVVAVPLVMRNRMLAFNTTANSRPQQQQPSQQTPVPGGNNGNNGGPMMRGGNEGPMMRGYNGGPMMRDGNDFQRQPMPGMRGDFYGQPGGDRSFNHGFSNGRFSPFGLGFMFIGGFLRLIPLALFALLLFGVYQLGKRSGMRSSLAPAPVATQPASIPAASESENNETPSI